MNSNGESSAPSSSALPDAGGAARLGLGAESVAVGLAFGSQKYVRAANTPANASRAVSATGHIWSAKPGSTEALMFEPSSRVHLPNLEPWVAIEPPHHPECATTRR